MTLKQLRYAGFCEETEFGEEPPPLAAFDVDIASASLDAPSDPNLVYSGGLTRAPRTWRPGYYAPSGNIVYAADIRTIGWVLKWALGVYKFTPDSPAPGTNLHEFWASENLLPSTFCARLGKDQLNDDDFEHVFSGCVINSLQMDIEGEFVQLTLDIVARRDSKGTIRQISTLALPTGYPLAFHEAQAFVAGGEVSAKVNKLSLSITNNVRTDSGRGLGSRHPYRLSLGDREVTLSFTLFHDSLDELERYWGDSAGPAVTGPTEHVQRILLTAPPDPGENTSAGSLELLFPRCIHRTPQFQPSGRDELQQSIESKAFLDEQVELADALTVVSTEMLATLHNNEPEMVVGS